MLAAPAIILTAFVTLLAVLISLAFAIGVARARRRTGIDAPAMSGSPDLERALRIQGNTVEQFVIFLPSLWLAALYFPGWWAPILGLIWCLGRITYYFVYGDAKSRFPGFAPTVFSTIILWILAAIGIVQAWMASA
ncbi:MAG: MAPEG family protein [Alphaproteobacteria bacterium]|nr:MAPEG family protein [Alphaproteobacteria bacterium]